MSTASIFSEEVSYNLQSHKENLEWLDIDDSFVKIVGGFGRYQILMTFLLSLLAVSYTLVITFSSHCKEQKLLLQLSDSVQL